jgi:hypothetical protein
MLLQLVEGEAAFQVEHKQGHVMIKLDVTAIKQRLQDETGDEDNSAVSEDSGAAKSRQWRNSSNTTDTANGWTQVAKRGADKNSSTSTANGSVTAAPAIAQPPPGAAPSLSTSLKAVVAVQMLAPDTCLKLAALAAIGLVAKGERHVHTVSVTLPLAAVRWSAHCLLTGASVTVVSVHCCFLLLWMGCQPWQAATLRRSCRQM